jgi:dephospho-CoA kinase
MNRLIGLTGKSGAGKGVVCDAFRKRGIPCIDADRVYHEMLLEDNACTKELIATFGSGIAAEVGVDRRALSRTVFASENVEKALHTLNGITHKYIMAKVLEMVQAYHQSGHALVVFDAPQLFEAGAERFCDVILGVTADDDVCMRRIMARDGIDGQTARRRLEAQHDTAFFQSHCHAVIENNGNDPLEVCGKVDRFIKSLEA